MKDADTNSRKTECPDEEKTPAALAERELQHVKNGMAILVTCLVHTLTKSDPSFQDRFLRHLSEAYYEVRDNSDGEVRHELELLSWTRSLLTGFNLITGQGKPFLAG
jgi:hypothetical protein